MTQRANRSQASREFLAASIALELIHRGLQAEFEPLALTPEEMSARSACVASLVEASERLANFAMMIKSSK